MTDRETLRRNMARRIDSLKSVVLSAEEYPDRHPGGVETEAAQLAELERLAECMTDRDIQVHAAVTYRVAAIGRELDSLSPELRNLIRLALTGANGEAAICNEHVQHMARLRLNEAANSTTKAAQAERKAALLLAFQS